MAKLFLDTCLIMNRPGYASGYNWRVSKKAMSVNEIKESGLVLTQANLDEIKIQFELIQEYYADFWAYYGEMLQNSLDAIVAACMKPKRVTKWINEYVIQENCGYGWDDSTTEETMKEAKAQLKCYRENVSHATRIITRRVPNPAYTA